MALQHALRSTSGRATRRPFLRVQGQLTPERLCLKGVLGVLRPAEHAPANALKGFLVCLPHLLTAKFVAIITENEKLRPRLTNNFPESIEAGNDLPS